MTQEEKNLLLQDLCARLPYGIQLKKLTKAASNIADIGDPVILYSINLELYCDIRFYTYKGKALTVCEEDRLFRPGYFLRYKPYLFPMSSMTEEQNIEYGKLCERCCPASIYSMDMIDWFIKNHFDYRGLIPMGLAEDATGKNIY